MRACLAIALALVAATAAAQQVTKETIPGVTNFARLETTVACGGATTAAAVPEKFLQTLTTPGNEPAYIHCASGNRAAAMWMIKRIAIDHWDADKAASE